MRFRNSNSKKMTFITSIRIAPSYQIPLDKDAHWCYCDLRENDCVRLRVSITKIRYNINEIQSFCQQNDNDYDEYDDDNITPIHFFTFLLRTRTIKGLCEVP